MVFGYRQVEPLVLERAADRRAVDRRAVDRRAADRLAVAHKRPVALEVGLANRQVMPSLAISFYVQQLLRQLFPWLPFLFLFPLQVHCLDIPNSTEC